MVSKIKSRVWLGITTIIPESQNSLGAKVPCYNFIGTIQRLCAYSKAMISQGTRGTSILNMQKQQKSIRPEELPPPSPPFLAPPLGFPNQLETTAASSRAAKGKRRPPPDGGLLIQLSLHFEAQPLKNRHLVTCGREGCYISIYQERERDKRKN